MSNVGESPIGRGSEGSHGPEPTGSIRTLDPNEIGRARAVIWVNLVCVLAWIVINVIAGWQLGTARPVGVAAAGVGMAGCWAVALRLMSTGQVARGVGLYTVSGLLLLLAMGMFVPELSLLFAFATFIFLAFGLSYMSGKASTQVVALTLSVALMLLVTSVGLGWSSGVPLAIFRWVNLTGMLMALSIDATMFVMLRRTLEARSERLVAAERAAATMQQRMSQQERLESLGKLAGGVAHDFNNLLAIILNCCHFVAKAEQNRPEVLKDVEHIRTAAQRAAALTRQLLIFGQRKLDSGELVNVNQVVRDSATLLRSAVGEQVEVCMRLDDELPPVRIDTSRIEQILLNLSINGRDAMPEGGKVLITTSTQVSSGENGEASNRALRNFVCLTVSDTGTGFTDEARRHAFEPFFTTKQIGSGTGLGLATVHEIVKTAGGYTALYSESGVGSTMRIYLPAADDTVPASLVSTVPIPTGDGRTVLVVEDEPQLREIVSRMLESQRYRVHRSENAPDALRLLETDAPIDLLLTDVVMPGISGSQLTEQAKALRPQLRILYMSGYPQDLWEPGGIDAGAPMIEKPFNAEQLLRKVSEAVG